MLQRWKDFLPWVSATLTSAGVLRTAVPGTGEGTMTVFLDYTKGDETSLDLTMVCSTQEDVGPFTVYAFQNGSLSAFTKSFTTTGKYAVVVPREFLTGGTSPAFQVKATGGTPTGTFKLGYQWGGA